MCPFSRARGDPFVVPFVCCSTMTHFFFGLLLGRNDNLVLFGAAMCRYVLAVSTDRIRLTLLSLFVFLYLPFAFHCAPWIHQDFSSSLRLFPPLTILQIVSNLSESPFGQNSHPEQGPEFELCKLGGSRPRCLPNLSVALISSTHPYY